MTIWEFVKKESGLKNMEAIHRLCEKCKTYMLRNKITKLDSDVVKKAMRMRNQ